MGKGHVEEKGYEMALVDDALESFVFQYGFVFHDVICHILSRTQ